MKNLFVFLLFISIISGCGPNKEESLLYDMMLLKHQTPVVQAYEDLELSLNDTMVDIIDNKYEVLKKNLDQQINGIKNEPNFDDTPNYKNFYLQFLLEINSLTQFEYKEILELLNKPEHHSDEKEKKAKLRTKISKKYKNAQAQLKKAQDNFKEKYGIK